MRTARDVPTPLLCRNSMISRITFCSAQPAMIRSARFGPMPVTSRRRLGSCSMTSNTASLKARTSCFRIDRPDAADHARTEIFLDPLDGRRRRGLEERGPELDAVGAVVDPASARLDELAGRDHRGMAREGDEIALPAGFDTQTAEAGPGVLAADDIDH